MRSLVITLLVTQVALGAGCFNSSHARVPLRGNPDGADCFARCTAGDDATRMACVAACPSAQSAGGTCSADDGACAQTRSFSGWKTAGCAAVVLAVFAAVSQ